METDNNLAAVGLAAVLAGTVYYTLIKPLLPASRPTSKITAAAAAAAAAVKTTSEKGDKESTAPGNSLAQQRATLAWQASNKRGVTGRCVVTGGSGLVGQRLVEMLVERGATSVGKPINT